MANTELGSDNRKEGGTWGDFHMTGFVLSSVASSSLGCSAGLGPVLLSLAGSLGGEADGELMCLRAPHPPSPEAVACGWPFCGHYLYPENFRTGPFLYLHFF